MVDIYEFKCPHRYLKAVFEERKSSLRSYSMRAWATKLGMRDNSSLSFLINAKRRFTKKHVAQFSKDLKLNGKQTKYFEMMIERSNAKTTEQKKFFERKLQWLTMDQQTLRQLPNAKALLSSPVQLSLLEMIQLKNFQKSPAWIQSQLQTEMSREEISKTLARLVEMGLVEEKNGTLQKLKNDLITTYGQQIDDTSRSYQTGALDLARNALGKHGNETAKFSGYSFNLKRADVIKMIILLGDCIDQVLSQCEAEPGEGEVTYQFNIQAFPLTK